MGQPHKHAELIKAWADGARIEYLHFDSLGGRWVDVQSPKWNSEHQYRIKPDLRVNRDLAIAQTVRDHLLWQTGNVEDMRSVFNRVNLAALIATVKD